MLDINLIRKDPEFVKAALAKREYEVDFTELLQWDARRKEIIAEGEALKAERNRINKEIPRLKKEGADVSAVMAQMKESGEKVKSLDEELRQVEAKIEEFVAALPNLPADDSANIFPHLIRSRSTIRITRCPPGCMTASCIRFLWIASATAVRRCSPKSRGWSRTKTGTICPTSIPTNRWGRISVTTSSAET